MSKQSRSQLILGLILILAGAWFLATKTVPSLADFAEEYFQWPYTLMWIGALILVIGMMSGSPGMAVPAMIVAGIGGIFYYNDAYAAGQSAWSYTWTFIPGFIGLGSILAGLLGENTRRNIVSGLNLLVVSAVLFLVFASFFGGLTILGDYIPAILLIALGVWLLARSLWKSLRRGGSNA
ncbi:MAG: hypothetical protein DYG87_03265 [Anaerolineae bacterium CFX3]|jgi:hypothetical protein|nr:hypothetical protein [Anaerolineales bacterium]MCE7904803.1 hypothetical protein [Anaerolineae bacterium CFX3]MCQ3945835.1 hypothetical protein [Anaerolineae bacterium]OQY82353.1 MAG: hypothetical protein B6D40_09205 [Anaerolineae bacterium UTCFX3]GER81125.1 conserved hypothetical protein [Candidatus Denitrolinea symbiosum]